MRCCARHGRNDGVCPVLIVIGKAMNASDALQTISLKINGVERTLAIEPRVSLLDALRDHLGLHGSKKGCNQGACGACTVLVDGERINSCLTFVIQYEGREIVTARGTQCAMPNLPLAIKSLVRRLAALRMWVLRRRCSFSPSPPRVT